jgi:hypothetical protein
MKVGVVFTPIANFQGVVEALESFKSEHTLEVFIQPQYRLKVALSKAWNDGIDRAFGRGCDYALVCNDDILLAPMAIDAMIKQYETLRETEKVILVTPNNVKLEVEDPAAIYSMALPEAPTFSEHPNFSCFLVGREFFDLVGRFDENFWPAWYEDNDMHRRINLLGYKAITTTAAPQIHFGGVATSMLEEGQRSSAGSCAYYVKKWGGVPHPSSEIFPTPYNNPNLSPRDWLFE